MAWPILNILVAAVVLYLAFAAGGTAERTLKNLQPKRAAPRSPQGGS